MFYKLDVAGSHKTQQYSSTPQVQVRSLQGPLSLWVWIFTLNTPNAFQGNAGKCCQGPKRKNTNLEIPYVSHRSQDDGSKPDSKDHPNGYGCTGEDTSFIEIREPGDGYQGNWEKRGINGRLNKKHNHKKGYGLC